MGWMLFFMLVVLKIPLAAACWLVWYAIRAEPELGRGARRGEDRGPRRKLPPRPRAGRAAAPWAAARLQSASVPAGGAITAVRAPRAGVGRTREALLTLG